MGARLLRSRVVLRDADDSAPVTWDSKIDVFDGRKERVLGRVGRGRSDVALEDVRDASLYEFWWKFHQVSGKPVRSAQTRVLMVTPAWSADCACVLSDKHSDYARCAVVAYWRLMGTEARHQLLRERLRMDGDATESKSLQEPIRTVMFGQAVLTHKQTRFLGVQDPVLQFDTERRDAKDRQLGGRPLSCR